jgi:DNA-binding FrmR family transcriptional regulator
MKLINNDIKENLIKRLNRVEGQVRGVAEMLQDERDCREIMQQLAAAHSALQSTSRLFFRDYAAACMTDMENNTQRAGSETGRVKMIEDMLALLDKTP